jgi:molybdate transport repressor ModE-like protein
MNAQNMEWDDLRVVLAVGRQGSLSGAARDLSINHSTVFRRINAIEEKLGLRLFERLPTGYILTEAGESMVASAERIEAEIYGLSRQLVGGDMRLSGLLRVTAPDALALKVLMPHFARFCLIYPDIRFELSIDNSFLDLSMREADVAIRSTTNPPEWNVGRRLCNLDTTVYGSTKYLAEHSGASLDDHRWLMPREDQGWFSANKWLAKNSPNAVIA